MVEAQYVNVGRASLVLKTDPAGLSGLIKSKGRKSWLRHRLQNGNIIVPLIQHINFFNTVPYKLVSSSLSMLYYSASPFDCNVWSNKLPLLEHWSAP